MLQIPNEGLMRSEITNLSQSGKLRVRADFEADAAGITPELCEELAERLLAMMEAPDTQHLFSTDFEPLCHIEHLCDPLKYKARPPPSPMHSLVLSNVARVFLPCCC